jgi:hypothetical protein
MAEQTHETTAASAKSASQPTQTEELVESIVSALEARGVPAGTWLVDVVCVRQALRDADDLLRRLEDAIIRAANPTSPIGS